MNYSPYYYDPYPNGPFPPFQHPSFQWNREYPPVDTHIFGQSVVAFQKLMRDGSIVLNKLAEPHFAHQLMTAAQAGHQHEVDRLMKSIGVGSLIITTKYTPTGVVFTLDPNVPGTPCCTLTMALQWGA